MNEFQLVRCREEVVAVYNVNIPTVHITMESNMGHSRVNLPSSLSAVDTCMRTDVVESYRK